VSFFETNAVRVDWIECSLQQAFVDFDWVFFLARVDDVLAGGDVPVSTQHSQG